jgi:hypothetical protein
MSNQRPDQPDRGGPSTSRGRKYYASRPPASRIVPKPAPQGQDDPRLVQLGQVRRRYSPEESTAPNGDTVLKFRMAPSDPDFPYEMQALACTLFVPAAFPKAQVVLRVTNKEMGRGYQINVENGFQAIMERLPQSTILQHLYALDRDLETLLAAPKAETVKITSHARVETFKDPSKIEDVWTVPENSTQSKLESQIVHTTPPAPTYSPEQLEKAQQIRKDHVRQFEARMGRLPLFAKGSDGISYTVPVQPRRAELPVSLRDVQRIKLIVPARYNLDPCRIELYENSGDDARYVEQHFQSLVAVNPDMNLFALINKLSQTMHTMTKPPTTPDDPKKFTTKPAEVPISPDATSTAESLPLRRKDGGDKSHIVFIPRPPEWGMPDREIGDSEEGSSWDDDSEDADNTDSGEREHVGETQESHRPERGILISFPGLELYGIELMELITLSITVKCDRCKDVTDVPNLRDSATDPGAVKTVVCKKCSNQLSVGYRMDLLHANCVRAGYLDMDGCTVVDLLPSFFKPTCSECSTPFPAPGVNSVRGDSSLAICRECHKRLSFKIPDIKFLQVSATTVRASQAPRKKKEILGIRAGEQLPNRGRCSHYAKSYRWFRSVTRRSFKV